MNLLVDGRAARWRVAGGVCVGLVLLIAVVAAEMLWLRVLAAVLALVCLFLVALTWQPGPGARRVEAAERWHHAVHGEARFRELLESLPHVAVQGYDRQRRVVYWNDASEALYGYRAAEVQGRLLEELIIPEPMRADVIRLHDAWIRYGHEIPAGRLVLQHRDGSPVPVFSYHAMLGERRGAPVMFCVDVPLEAKSPPVASAPDRAAARRAPQDFPV